MLMEKNPFRKMEKSIMGSSTRFSRKAKRIPQAQAPPRLASWAGAPHPNWLPLSMK